MEVTSTIRNSPYAYLQLFVTRTDLRNPDYDDITLRAYLNSALSQYLGLVGTAISIDILKIQDSDAWVRVPSDDESAVIAALSQWTGAQGVSVRIRNRSHWLGHLTNNVADEKLWSLES
ncbi:hypothetical protein LTR64_006012 [Lithohypha guttulata]|uniref:Ribonucleases P/MRP subunit Pop8-like domain-containing protein n=1 Tax=Lithohypha guttulata TaxID=1690604 RepID=A0AAN7T483_9EURO|nr:hypothetical protein LTR05_000253 [Lithohypha guttulata]